MFKAREKQKAREDRRALPKPPPGIDALTGLPIPGAHASPGNIKEQMVLIPHDTAFVCVACSVAVLVAHSMCLSRLLCVRALCTGSNERAGMEIIHESNTGALSSYVATQ